jgi:hypothetical protein
VTDLDDGHDAGRVIDREEDSVVADAEAVELVFAFEFLDARRKEILLQTINAAGELPLSAFGKRC